MAKTNKTQRKTKGRVHNREIATFIESLSSVDKVKLLQTLAALNKLYECRPNPTKINTDRECGTGN